MELIIIYTIIGILLVELTPYNQPLSLLEYLSEVFIWLPRLVEYLIEKIKGI